MIERVRVVGFKSLRNVELPLAQLTLLIGANAAGKSNLLDAIGLLGRIANSDTLTEAFESQRGNPIEAFSVPSSGIEGLLAQPKVSLRLEADIRLSGSTIRRVNSRIREAREGFESPRGLVRHTFLRYSVEVEMRTSTGMLVVADESLRALNQDGTVTQSRGPFFSKENSARGRVMRLRLEGQSRPTDYDLGLDRSIVSMPLYPPHYPHVVALREELAGWNYYYLEPRAMREDSPLREVTRLPSDGSDLAAFFNTLREREPKRFSAVKRALRLILPDVDDLDVERTTDGLLRLSVTERGVRFPASVLSEGTLRVLALLAITNSSNPSTLVGYEEPENGVHPARLALLAGLFENSTLSSETQFLIATHSPVLPQHFSQGAMLVACRKRGGESSFEPMEWSPLFGEIDVEEVLNAEPRSTLSSRMLRGDFV